ncbi:MAG: TrmH family RNA methyltransferase [Rhodospirillales bacterium]
MVPANMGKRKHPSRPTKSRISRPRAKGAARRARGSDAAGEPSSAPYWIYGTHAVQAAFANPTRRCHRLVVATAAGGKAAAGIAEAGAGFPARPDPEPVDRADIERILEPGAVHQGVALLADPLPAVTIEDTRAATDGVDDAVVVILDQASDPRNVGAVLRSAAAFRAAAVVVQDRHAPPMTGALCKAASGAAEWVPLVRVVNIARAVWALKDAGYWCAGLDPAAGQTLAEAAFRGRVALVLGAEGRGLRRLTRETCDELAKVPVAEGTDSLNLSNAAAVALYELRRGRP